jgi:hypothetical protein
LIRKGLGEFVSTVFGGCGGVGCSVGVVEGAGLEPAAGWEPAPQGDGETPDLAAAGVLAPLFMKDWKKAEEVGGWSDVFVAGKGVTAVRFVVFREDAVRFGLSAAAAAAAASAAKPERAEPPFLLSSSCEGRGLLRI